MFTSVVKPDSEVLPPPVGVCQFAVVDDVAVSTLPVVGAVALLIDTVPVAVLNLSQVTVLVTSSIVLFVKVCVVLMHTKVHEASGTVKTLV